MAASPDEILSMVMFARVVEAKSFTAAALKLGVSKSVVSARVAALEAQLKVRLLHRTTRKLALTPDGMALYERCARVAVAADEASSAAARTGDAPRGLLRVDAPSVFAQEYLVEPIAAYLDKYPDARVDLTMTDRHIDLVGEGVDVVVRIVPQMKNGALVARRFARDRTVLCAAPAYLARRGIPTTPADLLHHQCLVYSLLKVSDEWRFRSGGERFSVPVDGRFLAGSGAVLRRAALAGLGIAVLPTFMIAEDVAAGRLQILSADFEGVALSLCAVYPQGPRPPSKVRAFVDLLVDHFRKPPWDSLV